MAIGKSKKQLLSVQSEFDILLYDTIPVTNIIDINPESAGEDITVISPSLGSKRNFNDKCNTKVNFNIETYITNELNSYDNGVTIDTFSNLDTLFKQNGMKVDSSVTDMCIYTPDSNSDNNSKIKFYKEDILRTIDKCRNSMTISAEVGKPIAITFNNSAFTDLIPVEQAPIEESATITEEGMYILCSAQGYTEDGIAVNMQSFTLNANTELTETYAIGLSQYDMTDYDYQLEVTALKIKNDISNWQNFNDGLISEIILTAVTKDESSQLTITIPAAKMLTNVDGEDTGRQTVVRNFRCENDTGDDNISIKIDNTYIPA